MTRHFRDSFRCLGAHAAGTRLRPVLMAALMMACAACAVIGEPEVTITNDGRTVWHVGVPGETALTTLKRLTDVRTRTLAFGEFVVAINGLPGDGNSQFWAFYVNGEKSRRGAGEVVATPGDTFTWELTRRGGDEP